MARKLKAEINNGYAAMLDIIGDMIAEKVSVQTMYKQYAAEYSNPSSDGKMFS